MAKSNREEAKSAAQFSTHWRARALEFRRLARGPEASQYRRAAEQAKAIAERFERAKRFTSDFVVTVDGEPVYAEIDRRQASGASKLPAPLELITRHCRCASGGSSGPAALPSTLDLASEDAAPVGTYGNGWAT